jgi:4'-phosphopantetheinyl transferase
MQLPANAVDVWLVDLDDSTLDGQSAVLEDGELAKAARFATARLRSHYRRCRSSLRLLLAAYCGQPAATLHFETGCHGKPSLAEHGWHFNVSHSGALALITIARSELGIDLEALDCRAVDPDELLALVCNDAEACALRAMTAAGRRHAFYQLWTRKEAFCKAVGLGLQIDLPAVRLQPHPSIAGTYLIGDGRGPDWFCRELPAIPGYAASLCVSDPDVQVRFLVHRATGKP